MKVGIIIDQAFGKIPSLRRYTRNLAINLTRMHKDVFLIHKRVKEAPLCRKTNELSLPNFSFPYIYSTFSPLSLLKYDFDIIHYPGLPVSPLFFFLSTKKVLTIHGSVALSTLPFKLQQGLSFPEMMIYYLLKASNKKVNAILTVSKSEKQAISNFFKIPEERIKVTYLGVDENFRPLKKVNVKNIEETYGIETPFIMHVSSYQPAKNIVRLIKAFQKCKRKGIRHKLLLVGPKRWAYREAIWVAKKLDLLRDIFFIGHVQEADLPKLYNLADVFLFPSLWESFGLPPLEAMACGCPVITSNVFSLPEVVGDAGILVDPMNTETIANAIYELLTDDALRNELRIKGLKRAKMFTWEETARETYKVYEEL